MGKLRDALAFIIRPWAASSIERGWTTVGGQGEYGDEVDEKSAIAVSTYYACIRNIAEDTAKLPFSLIRNEGRKRSRIDNDPLVTIFATSPNPRMTAYTFRCTLMHWACGWGNGYAEKIFDGAGRVRQLNPIHPSRVLIENQSGGRVVYKVYGDDSTQTVIPEANMFHLYGMSGDGRKGYSVVQLMTNTLGLASIVQRFAKNFYQNSARPAGVLETAAVLKKEVRDNLASSWASMYAGPMNAGKTAVLEAGTTYKTISMPMKDMEFIELRRFQKEEIAGWFRMPLYKLQDVARAQGWSTLDAQETDYVSSCLIPWILRFEQEIKRQLMPVEFYAEDIYPHCEVKGLLRGDVKTRSEFARSMLTNGALTPNEWRAYEDMDPSDDPAADELYIQSAMTPLSKAGTQIQPTTQSTAIVTEIKP